MGCRRESDARFHGRKRSECITKLTKEGVVTIHLLRQTGETDKNIAARLGITEGAVRYHLRRQAQAASDGLPHIAGRPLHPR